MTDALMPMAPRWNASSAQWCQSMNDKTAIACRACGTRSVFQSGERIRMAAPHIRDMTETSSARVLARWKAKLCPWPRSTWARAIPFSSSTT